MKLRDKVAIVTGAASGIGLATARRFAADGSHVVLADLNGDKAAEAAATLSKGGSGKALGIPCDVSREADVSAAVAKTIATFGRWDVVVNNAGLMIFKPLEEVTTADWMRILSVDLLGAFYFTREAFAHMSPNGAIVNVSSIHAVETTPLVSAYAAAKAALLSLTRSAAIEAAPKNIRVNAVLPGAIDTPMLWNNPNVKSGVEHIDPATVGKAEDIADVIAFLASDEAAFVQGAALRADGGRLSRL